MEKILIYTKFPCPYCDWAKELLAAKGVAWVEVNVTAQPERFEEMVDRAEGMRTAPQIFIGDRHVGGWDQLCALNQRGALDPLLAPMRARQAGGSAASKGTLTDGGGAVANGKEESVQENHRNVIILGSGCAGLTAAIYAARGNLKPLLIEGIEFGGQLYTTTDVENFPGFPEGILGPELIDNMKAQAARFGAEFVSGQGAKELDLREQPFKVTVDDGTEYLCDALIIATGASPKELGLPMERELRGHGISTCATCDAAFFRDQEVAVVGGGDTALEDGLFLTKFAHKVYVIHRRDQLRASKIMQDRALANEKIEFLWNTEVQTFQGDRASGLTGVRIVNNVTGDERDLEVTGCFIAIGHTPNTEMLRSSPVRLDEHGYVTGDGRHFPFTAIEGVFVAGDVHDYNYRQAVTAGGDGCWAAMDAERYLEALESTQSEASEPAAETA